jgi:hypothetical protein
MVMVGPMMAHCHCNNFCHILVVSESEHTVQIILILLSLWWKKSEYRAQYPVGVSVPDHRQLSTIITNTPTQRKNV